MLAALAARVRRRLVADEPHRRHEQRQRQLGTSNCTTAGQDAFVRDTLQSWYYWVDQLPNPDAAGFPSPEEYLEAVRYKPLDTTYSYITSKATSDAFYSDSQFIGFGLSYKATSATELRLAQTFPGSPAGEAGMDRGDTLLTVGGKSVDETCSRAARSARSSAPSRSATRSTSPGAACRAAARRARGS